MIGGVRYMPIPRKIEVRETSRCFTLVYDLRWQKTTIQRAPQNKAVICRLSLIPVISTRLAPFISIDQLDPGTNTVQYLFRSDPN